MIFGYQEIYKKALTQKQMFDIKYIIFLSKSVDLLIKIFYNKFSKRSLQDEKKHI